MFVRNFLSQFPLVVLSTRVKKKSFYPHMFHNLFYTKQEEGMLIDKIS